jgi:hypothetical protein
MVIYKFECSGPNNTTVEKNIQHHYEKGNNFCLYLDPLHGSRTPYVFSYEPIAMDVPISDPKLYGGREFIYPDWRFDGYEVGFEKNVYRPFEKYFPDKVNNFPPFCVSPTGIFVELRSMD